MMTLGSEDVGRCKMGEPTPRTCVYSSPITALIVNYDIRIQFLRDIHQTFGTSFKIVPSKSSDSTHPELLFSCYGMGYVNANRTLA